MANWYITLKAIAKTDETAAALLAAIEKAESDEEKKSAKENAKIYAQNIQTDEKTSNTPETNEPVGTDTVVDMDTPSPVGHEEKEINTDVFDLSAPAFNPRLAKMGINREEELFLKGVLVRKFTRDEKILMRRSIYNKKNKYMNDIQIRFKQERAVKQAAAANNKELQEYHNQRKYVDRIVEALKAHKNFTWMMLNIDGLTPEIVKELLKKPENVNAFRTEYPEFVEKFNKKYGG